MGRDPGEIGPKDWWVNLSVLEKLDKFHNLIHEFDPEEHLLSLIAFSRKNEGTDCTATEVIDQWLDERAEALNIAERHWEEFGRPEAT